MNAIALNAYKTAQLSAISPKMIEKMAFERAVGLLRRAADNIRDFDSYVSALKFNQTLWTLIQAGISEGQIQVPSKVKMGLLNLSLFIDAHTYKALSNPNADHLEPLIDIDLNIVAGLFPQSAAPSPIPVKYDAAPCPSM